MIVIPAVGRITETWTAGRTLRLNLAIEANKDFAESLKVTDTPTFILFDASGEEQQRWVHDAPIVAELPK